MFPAHVSGMKSLGKGQCWWLALAAVPVFLVVRDTVELRFLWGCMAWGPAVVIQEARAHGVLWGCCCRY